MRNGGLFFIIDAIALSDGIGASAGDPYSQLAGSGGVAVLLSRSVNG